MKSLAELKAIKEKAQAQMIARENNEDGIRVLVGMATCGIAACARPVLNKFVEEINRRGIHNVKVTQTGCIGICQYEPVVEVVVPGQDKVTYVKVDADKVDRIITEHIVNGKPVAEFTIGNYNK